MGILFSPGMVGLGVFLDFNFFNLCLALFLIPLGLCGLLTLWRFPGEIKHKREYRQRIEELNKLLKNEGNKK